MESLAVCAQNIAAYYASGLAVLVIIFSLLRFCLNRSFMGLLYGLTAAGFSYVLAYFILPTIVWFFVLGTFGIGAAACEGFW